MSYEIAEYKCRSFHDMKEVTKDIKQSVGKCFDYIDILQEEGKTVLYFLKGIENAQVVIIRNQSASHHQPMQDPKVYYLLTNRITPECTEMVFEYGCYRVLVRTISSVPGYAYFERFDI